VLAQLAGDREAVLAGQSEVEQHQIGRILRHQADQGAAGMRLRDAIAVTLQIGGQQPGDLFFVVENCDVDSGAHHAGRPAPDGPSWQRA